MSGVLLAVLIIFGIIGLVVIYKVFKPYFLKYDTTLLITGGLGSGKSLTSVKTSIVLIRKQRFYKYTCYNFFNVKIVNLLRKLHNLKIRTYNKRHKLDINHTKNGKYRWKAISPYRAKRKKPLLYSNIPVNFRSHLFGRKREWSQILDEEHLLLLKQIREYSVVFIDELPQFINQFNWGEELVQKNVNEFITYFRHYISGFFISNCQASDDVVVQIRRKLNQATWCFDFKKYYIPIWPWKFYTIRMCDIMLSDEVSTMSTTFIEENTKLHFGIFPKKGTYDTRCYSERYFNILKKHESNKFKRIKTNKILRLQEYISPLDDETTTEQKEKMLIQAEKLKRGDKKK